MSGVSASSADLLVDLAAGPIAPVDGFADVPGGADGGLD